MACITIVSACADLITGFNFEGDYESLAYKKIKREFDAGMAFILNHASKTNADLLAKATVFQWCNRHELARSIADDVCNLLK